jgi:hypothetical protein
MHAEFQPTDAVSRLWEGVSFFGIPTKMKNAAAYD